MQNRETAREAKDGKHVRQLVGQSLPLQVVSFATVSATGFVTGVGDEASHSSTKKQKGGWLKNGSVL